MANRLMNEQSLYLQQHGHNPVDWFPWGEEAFEKAKVENKPVLVSIGYAACHWCHVMERESFENEEVARYMNEHFVNIKVDREEHPDVDHMYMDAVQAITQSGGWPLNVFATPAKVPFYGGTYYPPQPLYGRASWMQVLQRIHELWLQQHDEVQAQSQQMLQYLAQISKVGSGAGSEWTKEDFAAVTKSMLAAADKEEGGFGGAPKFPATMSVSFLLGRYHFAGDEGALQHALLSLDKMAAGGIYDHLGGGFCRYSTDARWLAPHFEKMLYDNALLIRLYAEAYMLTRKEAYRNIAVQSMDFVFRELQSPGAGFCSALDADSEGVEGKYYTWTWDEWVATTGADPIATAVYGVVPQGNWEHTNILHKPSGIHTLPVSDDISAKDVQERVLEVNSLLLAAREKRLRPALDDKCLLGWNALMNMAITGVAAATGNDAHTEHAVQHMQWIKQAYGSSGQWLHTWKNDRARIDAKLDDYAYTIAAMLRLASVSGNTAWIVDAAQLAEIVQQEFLHEDKTFFYYSSARQTDIPVRKTDVYDGALPSANAVMAENLVWLGMLMERSAWIEQGRFMLNSLKGQAMRYPTSFSGWATSAQFLAYCGKTVVCTGQDAIHVAKQLQSEYLPGAFVVPVTHSQTVVPLLSGKFSAGSTEIYICDAEACMQPVSSVDATLATLKNIS